MAPRAATASASSLLRSIKRLLHPQFCPQTANPSYTTPHAPAPRSSLSRSSSHLSYMPSQLSFANGGIGCTRSARNALGGVQTRRTLLMEASSEPIVMQSLKDADSGIVTLTLNRPEAKNAIGTKLLDKLSFFLRTLHKDQSPRVLLIYSSVPRVFCAGADLKERRMMEVSQIHKFVNYLRATFLCLEVLPIPSIAVIEGAALGGGLELALSCDLRICGDEAIFGLPETSLAIIPGAGGTQRLPRLVGRSRAKDLIFTSRRIDAEEAASIGLVDHKVAAGDAYHKALEVARVILRQGPLAIKMAKRAIDHRLEEESFSASSVEEACYLQVLNTKDRVEALNAFAEKRTPVYHGD